MKIIKGDIWDYWEKGYRIIIPTNGTIKKDGSCVMGKGLALQAKSKSFKIDYVLGTYIKYKGNYVHDLGDDIICFPVKNNWWEKATLELIEVSSIQLRDLINDRKIKSKIYLPKVGCGNGKLNWKDVEPILNKYLDDRFIVVDLK